MDQQAFRQLISTPRVDSPQSSSTPTPRTFGKQKKRVVNESPLNSAELVPRKVGGSSRSSGSSSKVKVAAVNSTTGETYVDRAEARRLGKEEANEYSEVEALRKDFERRIDEAEDEEEREKLREQMNYLGGDAKHSALVRGLDYALLAQQRARLNVDSAGIDEDDLEEAYGSAAPAQTNSEVEKTKPDVKSSKFKPIGKSAGFKTVEKEEDGPPEYIWRDGKRLRKKKKKTEKVIEEVEGGAREASSSTVVPPSMVKKRTQEGASKAESSKQAVQRQADRERIEMPPPQIIPTAKIQESPAKEEEVIGQIESKVEEKIDSDDDSTDIFADAGRWNGLDDDDDDEVDEDDTKVNAPVLQVPSSGKRNWFSTGKDEEQKEEEKEAGPLPSALKSILGDVDEAIKTKDAAKEESSGSEEEEEEDDTKPQRLEGFSDSILGREGVRYMLEKKDDDGGPQKRKRKRSKKGKGGYGSD